MKNEIIKFSVTDVAIKELATKYKDLTITDSASYKICVAGIGEIRSIRVSVEKRRKELKVDAVEYGRRLDSEAKRITELLLPIENDLKTTKQTEDTRKDAIRIEKKQAEFQRIEIIQVKMANFPPNMSMLPQLLKMTVIEIQEMQDTLAAVEIDLDVFQEFTPDAIKAKKEKKKLLQEYYVARIQTDATEARQKAEAERQEQIRKDQEVQRIEQEKALEKQEEEQKATQAIQEAETEKLRITRAEIEAQKQVLKKEYDRLENEKIERKRIEQEKVEQAEKDRLAEIEVEQQEQVRIEREATEKIEKERAGVEEKARQEALRPDRENLLIYLDTLTENINSTVEPVIKTSEGKTIFSTVKGSLAKTFTDIRQIIANM